MIIFKAVLISKCKNLHFSDDAYNCLNNTLIPNLDVLIYPDQLPMFSGLTGRTHAEDWRLQDAWHKKWFQPDVLEKLVIIYEQIQLLQCPEAQLIATVSFSDVLRKFSNASTKYPNVMFDKNAPKKSLPYKSFLETLRRNIEGLIKLKTKQIPERFQPNIIEGTNLSIPLNDDLNVAVANFTDLPDNISDPKQFIFKVIRHKCRNKKYKEMLPLRGQAIGIEYNPQIVSFITNNWNIENAMNKSPSLKRAIQCFASRLSSI